LEEKVTMTMTREDIKKLKKKIDKTEKGGVFKYRGHEFLREYAEYLLEYLEGQFERKE